MLIHKFNLKDYALKTHKAFVFYEVLMKMNSIKKTKLLDDLLIPATSYRYAKRKEQNIGKEILFKLEKHFQINPLSIDKIDEYENTISRLYQDIYYRNIDNISKYSHQIDQYIEENNILKPIFMIFKVWINFLDVKYTPKQNKLRSKELFNEIKCYNQFFTEEIGALFKIVEVLNADEAIDSNEMFILSNEIPYLKGMIYFALVTNSFISLDYKSVIIYGKICEDELIKDLNYKRLWSLTLNIVASLNALGYFSLAHDKVIRKISCVDSFSIYENTYNMSMNHYYVASIGIGKIEEIFQMIECREKRTSFEQLIQILIYYKRGKLHKMESCHHELLENSDKNDLYYKVAESINQIFNGINLEENFKYLDEVFYAGYVNLLRKCLRRKK